MEIKSDKENKQNPSTISKIWKYITADLGRTGILLFTPVFIFLWTIWFPEDYIWLLTMSAIGAFLIGLLTDGKLFNSIRDLLLVNHAMAFLVAGFWLMLTPTSTEVDTMDLKPFIIEIKANDKKDTFVIKNKLPFESEIQFTFEGNSRFNALFVNKEYFNDFNISVTKSCSAYRIKNTSWDVTLNITHKDIGDNLLDKVLYNSVYPKKLKMEMVKN